MLGQPDEIERADHRAAASWSDQLNKALGLYRDGGDDNPERMRQYTAMEVEEAVQYARWRLCGGHIDDDAPAQDAPGIAAPPPGEVRTDESEG